MQPALPALHLWTLRAAAQEYGAEVPYPYEGSVRVHRDSSLSAGRAASGEGVPARYCNDTIGFGPMGPVSLSATRPAPGITCWELNAFDGRRYCNLLRSVRCGRRADPVARARSGAGSGPLKVAGYSTCPFRNANLLYFAGRNGRTVYIQVLWTKVGDACA